MNETILPCMRIQHDWNLSFKDYSPIWISYEFKGKIKNHQKKKLKKKRKKNL